MAKLVEKSLDQLLIALEEHLYLVSKTLLELGTGDAAHMRILVAQLRSLICKSSGLPGLLWRLCDQLSVDDSVSVKYPGKVDLNNPINRGLQYSGVLVRADGNGPPALKAVHIQFRKYIEECEAVFVGGESMSHEYLINRLANETGVAHEADGVSRSIAKLNSVRIGDVQPYFSIVDEDARLTLIVGERVIQKAITNGYSRRRQVLKNQIQRPLENTKFSFKPEVPEISTQMREGTIALTLGLSNLAQTQRLEKKFEYPPFRYGNISVFATISRRRRLKISTNGFPLIYFSFECRLPDPLPLSLPIHITWKGNIVKAYVAGKQISGPQDES